MIKTYRGIGEGWDEPSNLIHAYLFLYGPSTIPELVFFFSQQYPQYLPERTRTECGEMWKQRKRTYMMKKLNTLKSFGIVDILGKTDDGVRIWRLTDGTTDGTDQGQQA